MNVDLEFDIQDGAVRKVFQTLRVALVGTVKTFKRATSRANVDFMTRLQGMDGKPYDEPAAVDLPVMHQSGDGYGLWHDMAEGDPGLVVACDGPVRGYFESGQKVTPGAGAQAHSFGSAVIQPGGRVSNTETPTQPPNDPGTGLSGAGDRTACIVYRRAGHPLLPGELGTTVVNGAAPIAGVRLGADDATLGVARLGDPVAASTDAGTLLSAVATFINGLAPGTIPPPMLAAALAHFGDISGASVQVVSK